MDHVEVLRKLSAKWRNHYQSESQYGEYGEFGARGFLSCADELDATITTLSAKPLAVYQCTICPVSIESGAESPKCPECGRECMLDMTAKPEGEAVAWDCRQKHTVTGEWLKWIPCSKHTHDEIKSGHFDVGLEFQARSLYTHPPRSHGVVVDEAMVERARQSYKAIKRYYTGDYPEGPIRSLADLNRNDDEAWHAALVAALGEVE